MPGCVRAYFAAGGTRVRVGVHRALWAGRAHARSPRSTRPRSPPAASGPRRRPLLPPPRGRPRRPRSRTTTPRPRHAFPAGLAAAGGAGGWRRFGHRPVRRPGSGCRRRVLRHRRHRRIELVELAGDQVQLPHALGGADVAEPDVAVRVADPALAGSTLDPRSDRVAVVILGLAVNVVHVRTVGRDRRRRTGLCKGRYRPLMGDLLITVAEVPSWETC